MVTWSSIKKQVWLGKIVGSLASQKIWFYPLLSLFGIRGFWLGCFISNLVTPHKIVEILVNLHCAFNKFITLKKHFFMFLFLGEREGETEHEQGGGRERGRHRVSSRLQALSCRHRDWRGAPTLGWWNHGLSEVGCSTNWTTHVPP